MTDLTAKSNAELAEASGCHPDLWSTLEPSLAALIALVEQRAIQRLEGKQASALQGDVAGLPKDTEVENWKKANRAISVLNKSLVAERDALQARIAELESKQVPEWFQEQVLAVRGECNALRAEVLEVTGYWKAATAKNRQLLAKLMNTPSRLEELRLPPAS